MHSTSRLAHLLLLSSLAAAGCSDDEADATPPPRAEGGVLVDGIVCPSTPADVTVVPVAPFLFGSLTVEATVGGNFDGLEIQWLRPSVAAWEALTLSSLRQRADGRYAVVVTPAGTVADLNKDLKVRARANLLGCTPTDWVESAPLRIGDPFSGTTWVADDVNAEAVTVTAMVTPAPSPPSGSYRISRKVPVRHSLAFGADGVVVEHLRYAIENDKPDVPYANCTFDLAYRGPWKLRARSSAVQIELGEREALPLGPESSCTSPPLAELAISDPSFSATLPPVVLTTSVSYAGLLETPPQNPTIGGGYMGLSQTLAEAFMHVADRTGPQTSSLTVYGGLGGDALYVKQ